MRVSGLTKRVLVLTVAVAAFTAASTVAQAAPFSVVAVYGDSLSDNGNLFGVSGQPGPPYFQGRRSDGPVAVEKFAAALGAPLLDFAWIGATTGIGNIGDGGTPTSGGTFSLPGMQAEFAQSQASLGPYLHDGLFVVWGGANDFLSPSPLDLTPQAIISRAVGDELGLVTSLALLGARNILVPGLPDLGLTPFFRSLGPAAAAQASAATDIFNLALRARLPSGVFFYDTAGLVRSIVDQPGAYGFTNVTDACFDGTTLCADPSQYLFFDSFHPTSATTTLVAQGFLSTVAPAAVPEPSSLWLLGSGIAVAAAHRWRSRRERPAMAARSAHEAASRQPRPQQAGVPVT
jgi:phospholipase/lecithinase/hemolysin